MIQTVCEEHDYINAEVYFCADGTKTWKQCKNCGLLEPLPVIKQESEDELWEEVFNSYENWPLIASDGFVDAIKKSFSITRKNQ